MDERLKKEVELLSNRWPEAIYREEGRWVFLPEYQTPDTIAQEAVDICFQVRPDHPGNAPYGFYAKKPISLESGEEFDNVTQANDPPFDGEWLKFSWKPADWSPGSTVKAGSNLVNWAHTFHDRLEQGS